ncbi:tRNA lysidine(34) synthetase TilS [Thaumasiovibrio subtropicus]|uniref:tRNA lysidine(34) synthetase TilS n=1 Tax=Thaumasiovibrio subtropicus TaxID=1891207 RepID=UPI000B34BCA4|nr:tRNA lysidine(34) synthetase TilS [Thaumasiovibrio subtropicus]
MIYSLVEQQLLNTLSPSGRIVLGFSGGLDSRVLLELLARFHQRHPQYAVHVVHVHHGLSQHADDWESQCEQWAREAGLPFQCEKVVVDASDGGIEQGARRARYAALRKHMTSDSLLVTAQHQDDQCETLLLALKRGSGPRGLAAMPALCAFAGGLHLRPLLSLSRQALETYAEAANLSWVEDESNADDRYDRNFLRNQVLPMLSARWPAVSRNIARSAQLCADQESALSLLLVEKLLAISTPQGQLRCDALLAQDKVLQPQLLRQWLANQHCTMPSAAQLAAMLSEVVAAKQDANPQLCWQSYQLRRFQNTLWVVRPTQSLVECEVKLEVGKATVLPDGLGELLLVPRESDAPDDRASESLALPLRQPEAGQKVQVRFGVEGLKVQPVERQGGRRKMKKLFQEYAVPSWQRDRMPMVFYGEELAAIAGLFVCKGFEGTALTLRWSAPK